MARIRLVWYWKRYMRKSRYRYKRYLLYLPIDIGDQLDLSVNYSVRLFGRMIVLVPEGTVFPLASRKIRNCQSREYERSGRLIDKVVSKGFKNEPWFRIEVGFVASRNDSAPAALWQEACNLTKLARNCVRDSPDYCVGMANEQRRERRKREIHLYLREDLVEALERVASDSDLSVSLRGRDPSRFLLGAEESGGKMAFYGECESAFPQSGLRACRIRYCGFLM